MDGSTASLIAIPIVTTLALAAWLFLVAYAATRPQWKHGVPGICSQIRGAARLLRPSPPRN